MEGDKDVAAMSKMHKTLIFKMKIAIGHDKEGFKQAILTKDNKRFLELMNFSGSEYAEFSTKIQQHFSNFNVRYAADMKTIETLKKRSPEQCKTCQSVSSNSDATALDEQLAIIEKANVGSTDKIQFDDPYEYECRINKPDFYNQFVSNRIIIFIIFSACSAGAIAAVNPLALLGCYALWTSSNLYNMCTTCGCP